MRLGNIKIDWFQCAVSGRFFFPLPPTGSDLQCSASLLLRRFSQISESCFSSEPAGRQQSVEGICSSLAVSVIINNTDLFLFLTFWILSQESAAASPLETKSCTTTLEAFQRPFHPFPPSLCFSVVSVDCVCIFFL